MPMLPNSPQGVISPGGGSVKPTPPGSAGGGLPTGAGSSRVRGHSPSHRRRSGINAAGGPIAPVVPSTPVEGSSSAANSLPFSSGRTPTEPGSAGIPTTRRARTASRPDRSEAGANAFARTAANLHSPPPPPPINREQSLPSPNAGAAASAKMFSSTHSGVGGTFPTVMEAPGVASTPPMSPVVQQSIASPPSAKYYQPSPLNSPPPPLSPPPPPAAPPPEHPKSDSKSSAGSGGMIPLSKLRPLFIDGHTFKYQSDFDTNGLIFWIGCGYGTRSAETWQNPAEHGLVRMDSSPLVDKLPNPSAPLWAACGRTAVRCLTKPCMDTYISFDFGSGVYIHPSCYTLRHYSSMNGEALRDWQLLASNDRKHWDILDSRTADTSLNEKGATKTFVIPAAGSTAAVSAATAAATAQALLTGTAPPLVPASIGLHAGKRYRQFKIYLTGKNSSGHSFLALSGFEIYGVIYSSPPPSSASGSAAAKK